MLIKSMKSIYLDNELHKVEETLWIKHGSHTPSNPLASHAKRTLNNYCISLSDQHIQSQNLISIAQI